jgi:rubrerythrin
MGIAVLVADTGQFARHRATVDALFAALAEDERYEAQRFREALRRLQR